MPRRAQAASFFVLLAALLLVGGPYPSRARLFSVLLAGSIVALCLVYVLPWVYLRRRER